jgi:hypothetical protein
MWWKSFFNVAALACVLAAVRLEAQTTTPAPSTNATPTLLPPPTLSPKAHRVRVLDADNHNILVNRPGMITVVVGTSEDSQDAAREAGKAMYPFQGRPDFALIVMVDLRNSIAGWVPSVVISRMKTSLDGEAVELKPYFLKNGNKANPRTTCHVVPDFSGTVFPQLGWNEKSDGLRILIFGVDGREIERIDQVDDMAKFQADVKAAIQAQVTIEQARFAAAAKTPGSKILQPVLQHPPLVPFTAMGPDKQ